MPADLICNTEVILDDKKAKAKAGDGRQSDTVGEILPFYGGIFSGLHQSRRV